VTEKKANRQEKRGGWGERFRMSSFGRGTSGRTQSILLMTIFAKKRGVLRALSAKQEKTHSIFRKRNIRLCTSGEGVYPPQKRHVQEEEKESLIEMKNQGWAPTEGGRKSKGSRLKGGKPLEF